MADYTLALSDEEVERYRRQARRGAERDRESWALAGIAPGAAVADLGCGPGAVLATLAGLVGPSGRVVGVDQDPDAVARARTELDGLANAEVRTGDAADSGLTAGTFDTVVLRLLLAHNGGHEQDILDHAVTLLRPGGCLWVFDVEMTLVRHQPPTPPLPELHDRYEALHRGRGNDLAIGLRLGDLLEGSGLELLSFTGSCAIARHAAGSFGPTWAARDAMVADGVATEADVARWEREFADLHALPDQPRAFLFGFTAVGRRP